MESVVEKGSDRMRGRGVFENPPNRFEKIHYALDSEQVDLETPLPKTEFYKDPSRSILSYNDSPDVGFEVSLNPYRGCEQGCCYCFARPTHEYLGFSAGLDFESKILVKEQAPVLLQRELSSPQWRPRVIALSCVTDPYQPIERRLRITRKCLEVLAEFRNPVVVITKNHLIRRDIDLLQELARTHAVSVYLSVTTLDDDLRKRMEPRTSSPLRRIETIAALAEAKIPVGVLVAPVIPGLTDHEMPAIVTAAVRAGARFADYVLLRLPHAVAPLFEGWLERHRPERKEKVLHRIEAIRGGRLDDPRFGFRMEGEGVFARQIAKLFEISCRKCGIFNKSSHLSTAAFRRACGIQIPLLG